MTEQLERIREFFRENPRMWAVAGVAVIVGFSAAWAAFGGFRFGTSGSLAAAAPPAFVINDQHVYSHGERLSVSWSALGAQRCDAQGWFSTAGKGLEDTAESDPINACVAGATNQVGINCTYANGEVGSKVLSFSVDTSTCPGSGTPTPTPSSTSNPTPTPTGTSNGDCTLRDGLWYCKNLTCGLGGNGSNPPVGPATSVEVSQYRTVCDDEEGPNIPQVGCKVFLDLTPKRNGQEGFPPVDPHWTCSGATQVQEREGRYCYTPFLKPVSPGPVTCCANTGLPGDCASFTVQPRIGATPTPGTGTPAAAQLRVSCSGSSATLTWNIPARANANTIQRMAPGGSFVDILLDSTLSRTSMVDSPVIAGAQWRHKSGANVASNIVSCLITSPTPTIFPTPTPIVSGTPIVQGPPVQCTPARQTVDINQTARLQASGGTNAYTWNITQGGSLEEGGNQFVGVSYRTVGQKSLRVNSGGTSALCAVDVVDAGATVPPNSPTPTPTPIVSPVGGLAVFVEKTAQNTTLGDPVEHTAVTIFPDQTAQFRVRVTNNGTLAATGVSVFDVLPDGMSFIQGSVTVDGQPVSGDAILFEGLSLGRIEVGRSKTVEWSAVADRTHLIIAGPNQYAPSTRVTASGIADVLVSMSVTVYGSGATSQAGGIPTGPGGTMLAALATAAVLTLLYSGYTRSALYRRRDALDISRDQDPLDLRS